MYRMCTRCVRDASDPDIQFNEAGRCNHCLRHAVVSRCDRLAADVAAVQLAAALSEIKRSGQGERFDCIIGLSGGVDSTDVAMKAVGFGLRPLTIHLDNGWNAPEAIRNIKCCVDALGLELKTKVLH